MKLFTLLGGKVSHARQVKNAARWATPPEDRKPVVSNLSQSRNVDPVSVERQHWVEMEPTEVNATGKQPTEEFQCLNDIFSELIEDNGAMGSAP